MGGTMALSRHHREQAATSSSAGIGALIPKKRTWRCLGATRSRTSGHRRFVTLRRHEILAHVQAPSVIQRILILHLNRTEPGGGSSRCRSDRVVVFCVEL